MRSGTTVGLAWDGAGALLVSIDGAAFVAAFSDCVLPGAVAGAVLFPAFSGSGGSKIRYNLGGRAFQNAPPSSDYVSCTTKALQQVLRVSIKKRVFSKMCILILSLLLTLAILFSPVHARNTSKSVD